METTMQIVEANGLNFMTAIAGTGPRLLFISGTGADLRGPYTPVKSTLVDHFEVLTYDQRGLGQSEKPDQSYTMADYANDAAGILDAFGWDDALIAGYSFGGMVAQEFAIRHPLRVRRLVLGASAPGGAGGSSFALHELADLSPYERARKLILVADLSITAEWMEANPQSAEKMIQKRMEAAVPIDGSPEANRGRSLQLAARKDHDTWDRLDRIKAPTLVLAGSRDGMALESVQRGMAERIAGSELRVIDGNHGMIWFVPETLEAMTEFLTNDQG